MPRPARTSYGRAATAQELASLPDAVRAALPTAPQADLIVRPNGRVVAADKNNVAASAATLATRVLDSSAAAELKI